MKSPIIKIYILNILDKEFNFKNRIVFLSAKRARKYFDVLNKFNDYYSHLEIGTLRFW